LFFKQSPFPVCPELVEGRGKGWGWGRSEELLHTASFAMLPSMLRSRLFLLLILAAAFLFRVQTLHWNFFIHADTEFDTEATASLVHYGKLLVFPEKLTIVPTNEPLPPLEQGEILTQHGPLWPILGATVMRIFGWAPTMANAFLSLRILSLLSGLAIIALSYFITRKLIHEYAALACASFLTFSYVMADYSGNGSMYSLQTALYLLWIWSAMNHALRFRVAYLGIITGLSYLLNFQSIILIPATIILLLLEPISWRKKIPSLTLALILALVVVSPWLIRNAILFGDPLYSHVINQIYVLNKAGYQPTVENGLYRFHLTFWDYFSVIIGILQVWLPNNLYYAARKLFILAPIAFFFFSYGLIDYIFSWERLKKVVPILLVLTFHLLLSTAWPVMKFRYFVPILPLVFILSLVHLWTLHVSDRWKNWIMGATFACIIIVSILTYRSNPLHTTYFDGAVTQDPFHGSQELQYQKDNGLLPAYNE
jgi:4-amino-4-deoxy-L-arabinose transferase-like glycosyltransferase